MDLGIVLFSPLYSGSISSWNFICEKSNKRDCEVPQLNEAQVRYALTAGYITKNDANNIQLNFKG